jgi:hypothetical protein
VEGKRPVEFFGYGGGELLTVEEIETAARKYLKRTNRQRG